MFVEIMMKLNLYRIYGIGSKENENGISFFPKMCLNEFTKFYRIPIPNLVFIEYRQEMCETKFFGSGLEKTISKYVRTKAKKFLKHFVNEFHIFWCLFLGLVVIINIFKTNRSKIIEHITTTVGPGTPFFS
jgi:hypothetical protein